MKDLFICLLLNLKNHGNLVSATMYKGDEFAKVEVEKDGAVYTVAITKSEPYAE